MICYHTYGSLATLKVVPPVLKTEDYSVQLFVVRVPSYFSSFELITIVRNEMSLTSLALLAKHAFGPAI